MFSNQCKVAACSGYYVLTSIVTYLRYQIWYEVRILTANIPGFMKPMR